MATVFLHIQNGGSKISAEFLEMQRGNSKISVQILDTPNGNSRKWVEILVPPLCLPRNSSFNYRSRAGGQRSKPVIAAPLSCDTHNGLDFSGSRQRYTSTTGKIRRTFVTLPAPSLVTSRLPSICCKALAQKCRPMPGACSRGLHVAFLRDGGDLSHGAEIVG